MNALQEISEIMNTDDIKAFTAYLSKKNKRKDAGNIDLLNSLKTDDIKSKKNIFTDKKFKITQFTRIKKVLSDHFPIVADMKFESSNQ